MNDWVLARCSMLRNLSLKFVCFFCAALIGAVVSFASAQADTTITSYPSRGLQNALAAQDHFDIYADNQKGGFAFSGGVFSGMASGIDQGPVGYNTGSFDAGLGFGHSAELEGDQHIYAMMLDGRYDFNNDPSSQSMLHPYILGGMGVAYYGQNSNSLTSQSGDMMPLFRVGGGVTYHLGEQWDLSLDYKAGFSGASNQLLIGRNQQAVDLHMLNMGMHYQF